MILNFVLMTILLAFSARAQEDAEELSPDDKVQCVNKLLEWCNKMKYPEQGSGVAMISVAYHDDTGYHRVFCSSDSDGTNCTKNAAPWYSCSPDNTLTYKGEVLSESTTDVDDEICKTADKASNEFFFQTVPQDNTTLVELGKELEQFWNAMRAMQTEIIELQKRLMGNGPFMGGDFWGGFDGFPFQGGNPEAADSNEETEIIKEDTNNIERE